MKKTSKSYIIRIYGISEHGKSEVDHVGGIAKTTLRRQIATGKLLLSAKEMVEELEIHLEGKNPLTYTIDEITLEELEEARLKSRRILYGTITGTQTFQVVVFTPHSEMIKAAPRICLCETCMVNYGTCELFKEYEIPITQLKNTSVRSERNT
jgi:hypothetical protein